MESRSVYLGIATRLRGSGTGALNSDHIHSPLTEALWCAVAESERLFSASLLHAVMFAALCSHPKSDFEKAGDGIHNLYLKALETMPYLKKSASKARSSETDALVDEWKRINQAKGGGTNG